jgi:hypothetical protein
MSVEMGSAFAEPTSLATALYSFFGDPLPKGNGNI